MQLTQMRAAFAAATAIQPAASCRALVARPACSARAAPKARPCSRVALRAAATAQENGATATVPEPIVRIDNTSDPFATIVHVEYGNLLGELLDTVAAMRGLGLNIRRAKIEVGAGHTFYVTDARTSEKVVKSAKIEEMRLVILNNLLEFHPESGEQLAWGSPTARSIVRDIDPTAPLGAKKSIVTQVEVREHPSGSHTTLLVNTQDRPGLLTDIVRTLKDINLNVVSAEVDTIGRNAVDTFSITYHGEPLPGPMCQLVVNALQYFLSQSEVEKDWSESY